MDVNSGKKRFKRIRNTTVPKKAAVTKAATKTPPRLKVTMALKVIAAKMLKFNNFTNKLGDFNTNLTMIQKIPKPKMVDT